MKTTIKKPPVEHHLHRRLKQMGWILFGCGVVALLWDLLPPIEQEIDQLLLELEETPPPLNPYLVSSLFFSIGSGCFIMYWKKKSSF